MFDYATHYNGEYTQVYPLEECFRAIACRDAFLLAQGNIKKYNALLKEWNAFINFDDL